MKIKSFNIALIAIVFVLCKCIPEPEISQWRGPNRNGIYPETNLLTEWPQDGPELLWQYDDIGLGYTSAAVTSKLIYTTGIIDSICYLYALDHEGNLVWKKDFGLAWTGRYPGTRSTPLIYGGLGYVVTGRGLLVCFDAETGELNWELDWVKEYNAQQTTFGIAENLLIEDDMLFCTPGGIGHTVVALNRITGELIYSCNIGGEKSGYSSPILIEKAGKKYFVNRTAKSLFAIDIATGELVWTYPMTNKYDVQGGTPLYSDGYIFATDGWDQGSVLVKIADDGQSVKKVWRSKLFDLEHGDAVRIGDNIYSTSYRAKKFSCANWYTGEEIDSTKELIAGSVLAADGMIYCFTYNGKMALIKPLEDGFKIVSIFQVGGKKRDHYAYPVIYNGKLFIRYLNALMVYNISK